MNLHRKLIVITGAARGLGRGIAEVCAAHGARCLLSDLDADTLAETAGTIPNAHHLAADITSEADRHQLIDTAQSLAGRIDGFVNNAAVNFCQPFLETSAQDWDRIIGTNLDPIFHFMRATVPLMLEQDPAGGSIVNIASVHATATIPGAGPYAAAKAGIVALSQAVALEFASQGIRVNTVSPGLCDTQIWRDVVDQAKDKEACLRYWTNNIPLGRAIQPKEIGNLVAFLLSDAASAITGANYVIDGAVLPNLLAGEPYE